MEDKITINAGGINGINDAPVDTQHPDFLALKAMIQTQAVAQDAQQKTSNAFLSIRFQMESYVQQEGGEIILAGDFIEKFLEVIKVKKKALAHYLEYDETNLSALLKGRRKINSDLAIKLGGIFNVNPALWLHVESKNELLRVREQQKGDQQQYTLQALLKQVG